MAGLLSFRCNMMALKILHKHSFIMLSLDLSFALMRLWGCGLDSAKPFSFELQNNSVAREFLEMVLCNTVLQCLWRLIGEMYGVSKILITRM